jgi:hypothetical protein
MLIDAAVRANRWLAAHQRLVSFITWTSFGIVCADYARFIDLPTIIVVPFWIGVILNMLRWTLWQSWIKPIVDARTAEPGDISKATGETPPSQAPHRSSSPLASSKAETSSRA